ncbi:MAG TPA: type II toxin-antitoxin system RelE/ParE family toxin [Bdellovibrionota bacterium]|nr:type II toxin-antitoxin system RelE/ParE family toxin [Bdellovibrionota bacterium]
MENYSLSIKPSALKELEGFPKKIVQQIVARIEGLSLNPRPPGSQKLSGEEKYRLRQGPYRVVYAVDDARKVVDVVKIAHRSEVYR